VSRVVASAKNAATLYVSFTGFREDDTRPYLFVSNNSGRTWRSVVSNLPQESVNVIKEDPTHADLLYVGTDLGVYRKRPEAERLVGRGRVVTFSQTRESPHAIPRPGSGA
jgi:hypothetical protein